MCTAIVSTYTSEGFVIGADGLRREARTNKVATGALKLYFTETASGYIGYAWAGTTSIFADADSFDFIQESQLIAKVLIPLKVGGDSDLNPVTGSGAKPGVFGAQRRWRSYGA